MRPQILASIVIGALCILQLGSSATGQEADKPTSQEREAMIARRDALAKQAVAKANQGDFAGSQSLMDEVLKAEKSIFGDPHAELLGTFDLRARISDAAKDWDASIQYRRDAVEMGLRLYARDSYRLRDLQRKVDEAQSNAKRTDEQRGRLDRATAALTEAMGLFQQGKHNRALDLAKQACEIRESVLGKKHPKYAESLNAIAVLYQAIGDYAHAEPLNRQCIAIQEELIGKEHPDYANSLNNLAALYVTIGKYDRAEPLLIQCKTIQEKVLGKEHLQYAKSLNNLAALYRLTGEYPKAEPLFKESLAIREKLQGRLHPNYAGGLNNLATLYDLMGDYALAEPLLVESKRIREQVLGKDHPAYTNSLNNLAHVYQSMGKHARAESLYLEAKAIQERLLRKQHPEYAVSLCNLAEVYRSIGDYAKAEPLFLEAKAIREKILGKLHPHYAQNLYSLAVFYEATGDYVKAESFHLEAKSVREQTLGQRHPDYAQSLRDLAGLYCQSGHYAKAKSLYLEAKAIQEEVLGKKHPDYANSLDSLANLYGQIGDYARAEPLYLEAKAIRQRVFGRDHSKYANSLNNLAVLYKLMGDVPRSERLYLQAIKIHEANRGEDQAPYATALTNLAGLYESQRNYARAEPLIIKANAIREKLFGKKHTDYATSLNLLATVYEAMGEYSKAEPLYLESKTIIEESFGTQHPHYAGSLNNLAGLYSSLRDYARAEPLYLESKAIFERLLGPDHPMHANSLNNLAALHHSQRDYARAEPLYAQAVQIAKRHLETTAYVQSESQQMLMSQSVRPLLDHYLDCCLDGDLDPQGVIEQLVSWKGSILRRGRALRMAASDPSIGDRFRELRSVASQLSSATRAVPAPDKIDEWSGRFSALQETKRRLEVELMGRNAAFRQAVKPIPFTSIRDAIPDGGVLIDFLEHGEDPRSLVASIIPREGDLALIDLGSVEQAGRAIDTWRQDHGIGPEARAAGAELRRQIWEPLSKQVSDAELILISTDGVLGRFPLAALPGAKPGTFLIEDHRLVMIPVPQLLPDLIRNEQSRSFDGKVLLLGDVDYGRSQTEDDWPRLSETGKEVEFIKELVVRSGSSEDDSIKELRAAAATESAFRASAHDRHLLHLATHGFFAAADQKHAHSANLSFPTGRSQMTGLVSESRAVSEAFIGFSPGQLSGLVFAGANRTGRKVDRVAGAEPIDDGIMTADEIAFLPLQQTRLAVLSACETGLGEVAGGEGLIGIQRAFQIAGADSVVATMWKVDDVMTRKLMERFYQNLFVEKMSKLDALRESQLWLMRNPSRVAQGDDRGAPRKLRRSTEVTGSDSRTNPYYWAPFVLSGDWR